MIDQSDSSNRLLCCYVLACVQMLKQERSKMRMQSKRHFVQDFSFTSTASSSHLAASALQGPEKSFSDLSTVVAHHDQRNASSSLPLGGSFNLDSSGFNGADSALSSESIDEHDVSIVDADNITWTSLQYEESTLSIQSPPANGQRGSGIRTSTSAGRDTDIFTDVHTRSPPSSASRGTSSEEGDNDLSDVMGRRSTQSTSSSSDESVGQLVRRIQAKTGMGSTLGSEYSAPSSPSGSYDLPQLSLSLPL
jgi:hypothetical protein